MDETWMLLLLTIVMLFGSYLAGIIPLVVSMSEVRNPKDYSNIVSYSL